MIHALMMMFALCLCAPAFGQKATTLASISAAKKALNEKDYAAALKLLKPLAEQGNSEAQANLGLMYEHGQGVGKDFVEAFKWYRLAAEQGTIWAQTNLGLAYANGRGVEKNDQEATKWYRRAALQGNTLSQKLLVSMYEAGRGTPQDHNELVKWINPSNSMYISGLKKDYGKKIHFESTNVEKIIRDFNIDCKSNGRYLPLINIFLARLPGANENGISTDIFILEKNGEIRAVDSIRTSNGKTIEIVAFQINKWGELHPMGGVTTSAVLNACFGSYGPIWLLE